MSKVRRLRAVQWKLLRATARTRKELHAHLLRLHQPWTVSVQERHPSWPLDALLEMLLLTDGDPDEVERQLATWEAAPDRFNRNGIDRSYQQFLSILHAQHQQRITAERT